MAQFYVRSSIIEFTSPGGPGRSWRAWRADRRSIPPPPATRKCAAETASTTRTMTRHAACSSWSASFLWSEQKSLSF